MHVVRPWKVSKRHRRHLFLVLQTVPGRPCLAHPWGGRVVELRGVPQWEIHGQRRTAQWWGEWREQWGGQWWEQQWKQQWQATNQQGTHQKSELSPARRAPIAADDPALIRGKLRVMPSKHGASFVTCDRGSQLKDVLVKDEKDRNRGLDGEFVFVELVPGGEYGEGVGNGKGADEKRHDGKEMKIADFMSNLELNDADVANGGSKKKSDKVAEKEDDEEDLEEDVQFEEEEYLIGEEEKEEEASVQEENMDTIDDEEVEMWHDDEAQMSLWDPVVNLRKRSNKSTTNQQQNEKALSGQRSGKVIYILPPKSTAGQQQSELTSEGESSRNGNGNNKQQVLPKRTIVGTLTQLPNGGRCLLSPNNKSLPQFMCPSGTKPEDNSNNETTDGGKAFASKT